MAPDTPTPADKINRHEERLPVLHLTPQEDLAHTEGDPLAEGEGHKLGTRHQSCGGQKHGPRHPHTRGHNSAARGGSASRTSPPLGDMPAHTERRNTVSTTPANSSQRQRPSRGRGTYAAPRTAVRDPVQGSDVRS